MPDKLKELHKFLVEHKIPTRTIGINSTRKNASSVPIELWFKYKCPNHANYTRLNPNVNSAKDILDFYIKTKRETLNDMTRFLYNIEDLQKKLDQFGSHEIQAKINKTHLTGFEGVIKFYTVRDETVDFIKDLVTGSSSIITYITLPYNDNHLQIMKKFDNVKIVIGKPFYKRFKYSVKVKHSDNNDHLKVHDALRIIDCDPRNDSWMIKKKHSNIMTFFIKNDEIFTLLKLHLSDDVLSHMDITMKIPEEELD